MVGIFELKNSHLYGYTHLCYSHNILAMYSPVTVVILSNFEPELNSTFLSVNTCHILPLNQSMIFQQYETQGLNTQLPRNQTCFIQRF